MAVEVLCSSIQSAVTPMALAMTVLFAAMNSLIVTWEREGRGRAKARAATRAEARLKTRACRVSSQRRQRPRPSPAPEIPGFGCAPLGVTETGFLPLHMPYCTHGIASAPCIFSPRGQTECVCVRSTTSPLSFVAPIHARILPPRAARTRGKTARAP